MNKIVLVAAIASLSLVSCKKDRTCECTGTDAGITFSVKSNAKSTKKGAEEWCKGMQNATTTVDGVSQSGGSSMNCSIN